MGFTFVLPNLLLCFDVVGLLSELLLLLLQPRLCDPHHHLGSGFVAISCLVPFLAAFSFCGSFYVDNLNWGFLNARISW